MRTGLPVKGTLPTPQMKTPEPGQAVTASPGHSPAIPGNGAAPARPRTRRDAEQTWTP